MTEFDPALHPFIGKNKTIIGLPKPIPYCTIFVAAVLRVEAEHQVQGPEIPEALLVGQIPVHLQTSGPDPTPEPIWGPGPTPELEPTSAPVPTPGLEPAGP